MWTRRLSESRGRGMPRGCRRQRSGDTPAGDVDGRPDGAVPRALQAGNGPLQGGRPGRGHRVLGADYRELGEQKGYRLAYNLGVAYAELGDATRAAERLGSFLSEVDVRRGRNESLAAIVLKEESDARARIATLQESKGRIHVEPGEPPRAAQVDASEPRLAGFVAWVTPGDHTVTFAPGGPDQETKSVTVHAGERIDVTPSPVAPPPTAVPPPAPLPSATLSSVAPAPPPLVRREVAHPFSPALFAVSGVLAVGAGVAAIPLHVTASNDWNAAMEKKIPPATFYGARSEAYATLGGAIGLAAVTAGLVGWYVLGKSTREVVVTPAGLVGRF